MELVTMGTRDATIAGVSINVDGVTYTADGTSKREPHDADNAEIATLLATGRALENLSRKLLKKANGLVKHQDDIKKYQAAQKATPVKKATPVAKATKKVAKAKVTR